ncbi:MAG TPA: serine hydrolase domain-containing protein, partial [Candidatus Limnocylindrales bacterium]|nr:serine hydrolase domain-containing protein [Candidatus Limnocylindrales bacterium]
MARPVTPSRPLALAPGPRRDRRRPAAAVAAVAVAAGLALATWLGVGGGAAGSPGANGDAGSRAAGASSARSPATISSADVAPSASAAASGVPAPSSSGAGPSPSPQTPGVDRTVLQARLQATLDATRAKLRIPGVSATVVFADGTRWTGVSGLADVPARRPVTPETAFALASVSKTFTSAVILELVGEGRLRLTDPAAGLLPAGLPIVLDRRITVAMLLNHTSGLADYFLNPRIDLALQRAPTRAWTPAMALRYVGKRLAVPGKAWHYSNTNYVLLGLIAERLTGRSLAAEIRSRILDPVHLSMTWYQAAEGGLGALAHGYRFVGSRPTAKPIDLADGSGIAPFRSVVTAAAGAGSLAGTSGDLASWGRALYGGSVLGPAGTALLLSDFHKTRDYVAGVVYGYGIQAASIDGHPSFGHSGRLLGFRSVVRHFPIDGITIAVLTNQSRADPAV